MRRIRPSFVTKMPEEIVNQVLERGREVKEKYGCEEGGEGWCQRK